MQLRPYQTRVINDARALIRSLKPNGRKPRIVLRMPAGAGKTVTGGAIIRDTMLRGGTAAFLGHRDFLVSQAGLTFDRLGIPYGYMQAGKHLNPYHRCHLGMIGSMKTRQAKVKPPTVCIVDEGHHTPAATWKSVLEAWPETIFIALTATPSFRSDGKGLDTLFDGIVHGPSEAELIADGSLSDYVWYQASAPDLSKVHVRNGEYVNKELDDAASVIVADIVSSYRKHADGTIAVYFAHNVETSKRYAERFNAAGIPAAHLDAQSSPSERLRVIRDWARGNIKVITNVGLFGEGFDAAAVSGMPITIETVGLCRPTKSFPLLVQMAMRAMRKKSYPGIILDHANCFAEHNWMPDDTVQWSLSGATVREPSTSWECVGCGARVSNAHKKCPHCSSPKPAVNGGAGVQRELLHVDGDLIRIDREARRAAAEAERQGETRELAHLIEVATRQGYPNPRGWAVDVIAKRVAEAHMR